MLMLHHLACDPKYDFLRFSFCFPLPALRKKSPAVQVFWAVIFAGVSLPKDTRCFFPHHFLHSLSSREASYCLPSRPHSFVLPTLSHFPSFSSFPQVLCLDNFFTSQKLNIEDLLEHPNFEFVRHDVTEPCRAEVDQIYNMACPASPVHYQYNAIKTTKVSFLGAMHMLGLAKRVNARILQASTSEIYGDALENPQREEYWGNVNPIGVRACYDEGKRVAETMCFEYYRSHGVEIRIARIFNTYGPGMHPYDGRVVSNFIMQALTGEDITIYGDGSQTRSFCFVDDLVDGLMRLMAGDDVGPINIGNPTEFTIRELAELTIELTASSSRIIYKPLPQDDPKQRRPDISKARERLRWEPRVALREGLLRTIDYFKRLDMRRFKKPTSHDAHANSEKELSRQQVTY
ncbi:unnamed protein product [Phaeothamnion confervicola]